MPRSTRLQAKAAALCESDGSDLTDVEDLEAAPPAVHDIDSAEEGHLINAIDDSGVHGLQDESDSEDEYFGPGYKRPKVAKRDRCGPTPEHDAAAQAIPEHEPIVWTLDDPFSHLSDELTGIIFAHLGNENRRRDCNAFAQVCQRFLKVSRTASVRASWLFETYGKHAALYEAALIGKICDASTLDYLIDVLGVHASRYFFQMSTLAYTGRAPLWLDKSYCTPDTIPFANWLALLRKGCTMYPGMSPTVGKTDCEMLLGWIESEGTSAAITKRRRVRRSYRYNHLSERYERHESPSRVLSFENETEAERVKESEFEVIESLYLDYSFAPLNNRDPVNSVVLAKAAVINPEILPLATSTGFQVDHYFSRMVFQTIWNKEAWTPKDKAAEIEELCSLCPQLDIDADYFLCFLASVQTPDQVELLVLLENSDSRNFDFQIVDLIPELLELHDRREPDHNADIGVYLLLKAFTPKKIKSAVHLSCAKVCLSAARITVTDDAAVKMEESTSPVRVQKKKTKVASAPGNASPCFDEAVELMQALNVKLKFDDVLELFLSLMHRRMPELLKFVKEHFDDWQNLLTVAACSLLWSPHGGKQIKRLVNELPVIKETLRKVLLSEFRLDLSKLAKSGHKYYFPVSWSSPFVAMHNPSYQTPTQGQIYLDPPRSLLHKRLNKQNRVKSKNGKPSRLVRCIRNLFAEDEQIMQQIFLCNVLQVQDSHLKATIEQNEIAISLEMFELLAAVDMAPPDVLFDATLKAPFVLTHAQAVELMPVEEAHDLERWIHGFEQVLLKKATYLEMMPRHREGRELSENPFVLTLVEWKHAFEEAASQRRSA